jgi:putative ABC transport system permease protein
MVRPVLLLRWTLRDLRRRWLQVGAIALVLGIGTGVYAGLGSTAAWRTESNDASFSQLRMYDVRVRAAEGVDTSAGSMKAALAALPDPGVVIAADERLVLPTQIDASRSRETILVPGRIVGMDLSSGDPRVNRVHVAAGQGRALEAKDIGEDVVVLERNFAEFYDLDPAGQVALAGGQRVDYVGLGLAPEYFLVMTEDGGFFAQANLAVVFTSLETAQRLSGRPGRVNDLVIRLRPGVDAAAVAQDLVEVFAGSAEPLAVTVMRTEDEDAYRILYDDIEGDQKFWNVFAALILAGAAFGAFNLVSRMVEAQRREIGIGMALGASPLQLAVRPMLIGTEIAVLGALFGVGMGLLVIEGLRPVYTSMLPLPEWRTSFQPALFVRGAAIAFLLPLAATVWPVWRAVRVTPVDAIATAHRSARSGLAPLLRRLPWPHRAMRRMPLANVLRTPRRTLLTAFGIGAAITTLVAILGMLDSFLSTMDRNEREVLQEHPDRLAVLLEGIVDEHSPEIAAIGSSPSVGAIEPVLRVGGSVESSRGESIDVLLEAVDLDGTVWSPTISSGDKSRPGVVISEKAAADLGATTGSFITLVHPSLGPDGRIVMSRTRVPVAGTHPNPFRFNAYVDRAQLAAFGGDGRANQLYVLPAPGHTPDDVERELFHLDGVASVQPPPYLEIHAEYDPQMDPGRLSL